MKEYITRTQFNSIKNHLIVKTGKPMIYDLYDVLNAVFHILITGSQWRNLPDSYPPFKSVFYYYNKWKKNKVVHLVLYSLIKKRKLNNPRLLIIDNQSVGDSDLPSKKYKGYDGHKKRKGLKRCILVDNKGLIHDVKYFPANTSDTVTARYIIEHYKESLFGKNNKSKLTIIGDKGFNSPKVKDWAKQTYNIDYKYIPRMKKPDLDTKTGWDLWKIQYGYLIDSIKRIRYVVERSFAWLQKYRRLNMNYERTLSSLEAFTLLAGIRMILRCRSF